MNVNEPVEPTLLSITDPDGTELFCDSVDLGAAIGLGLGERRPGRVRRMAVMLRAREARILAKHLERLANIVEGM